MAKERTQPTPIDKDEYEAFKNFVRDTHGSTRGHLSSEIERALREYRKRTNGAQQLQRIENDIATIKANLADVESDGGQAAYTPSEQSDAHARRTTKPAANQPRSEKIDYLITEYLDKNATDNGGVLIESQISEIVKSEYAFDDGILEDYVSAVYERIEREYPVETHPVHGKFQVWGDRLEQAKEKAEEIAQEEMRDLE